MKQILTDHIRAAQEQGVLPSHLMTGLADRVDRSRRDGLSIRNQQ